MGILKEIIIKSICLMAVFTLSTSCLKENIEIQDSVDCSFVAITETDSNSNTKSSIDSDSGKILWAIGDSISILGTSLNSKFISDNDKPSQSAVFRGLLTNINDAQYGLYPYCSEAAISENTVNVSLPGCQTAIEGSFAPGLFISLAKVYSSNNNLSFANLCGGVRFKLSKEGLKKIVFKANDNESLCGNANAAFSLSGKPYVKNVTDGLSSITLTNNDVFLTDTWYYIVCFPVNLAQGFTMTLYTDTEYGVIRVDEMCEIKRSTFASFSKLDSKVSEWKQFTEAPDDFLNAEDCMYYSSDRKTYFPSTEYQYGFSFADNETWIISNSDTKALAARIDGVLDVGNTVDVVIRKNILDCFDEIKTMTIAKKESNKIWLWSRENSLGYIFRWDEYKPVSKVVIDADEVSLYIGESTSLNYSIYPEDATNFFVRWTSSKPTVTSVDKDGNINALSAGNSTITAITADGIKGSCSVTVAKISVEDIILDDTNVCIPNGVTKKIGYTIVPSNASDKSVSWSILDKSIANVDDFGFVTGIKAGETKLICTSLDSGRQAECSITVSAVDLSANGTANCYVVSHFGDYSFNGTVKGHTTTSVGSPVSAEVLWESFGSQTKPEVGDIISSVKYDNGQVKFSVKSPVKNGNAVIVVRDDSSNILWSWHIWVCDGFYPDKTAQVYKNNAGTMMDRNLGATSATPGDFHAFGLLYQWGRKDPFPGNASIEETIPAAATPAFPEPVASTSSTGTIQYAVEHPSTFITSRNSNSDWYYTGTTKVDKTRWTSSKGVYDPCPSGWQVPGRYFWYKAFGNDTIGSIRDVFDEKNHGMNFGSGSTYELGRSSSIWYPLSGGIYCIYMNYSGANRKGCWWTYSIGQDEYGVGIYSPYVLHIDYTINCIWTNSNVTDCATAYSVRCMKM